MAQLLNAHPIGGVEPARAETYSHAHPLDRPGRSAAGDVRAQQRAFEAWARRAKE